MAPFLRPPKRRVSLCWLPALCLLATSLLAPSACAPAGDFEVVAVVLATADEAPGTPRVGDRLEAGARVRAGETGPVTLGLMPGTVAALGAGSEARLGALRLLKNGSRMLGREVGLALVAGELELLIAAPEEAAPTRVTLGTPAGDVVAGPGCLARVRVQTDLAGTPVVHVLCARGELRCAGELVPAGRFQSFPGAEPPRPVFDDGRAQRDLADLLEHGGLMQAADIQRQARPPGWRTTAP